MGYALNNQNFANSKDFRLIDDFHNYTTAGAWTTYTTAAGTVATATTLAGGTVLVSTTSTSANECGLRSTNANYIIAAAKPLYFRSIVTYVEANTNTNGIFIGFSSTTGSNLLASGGLTPYTGGTSIGFFKPTSSTTWNAVANNSAGSATAVNQALDKNNSLTKAAIVLTSSATVEHTFELLINPRSSTLCDVRFILDDVTVYESPDLLYTSAANMYAWPGYLRTGSAGVETMTIDYCEASQKR